MTKILGHNPIERDGQRLGSLIHAYEYLHSAAASTATSATVTRIPAQHRAAGGGWVIFDVGTTEAEVRKYTVSGNAISWTGGLAYSHASGDPVLFIDAPVLAVEWFGAVADASTDNSTPLARASAQITAIGGGVVKGGGGQYNFATSLALVNKMTLIGDGPEATHFYYTGTGDAVTLPDSADFVAIEKCKITRSDTANAGAAVELGGSAGNAFIYYVLRNVTVVAGGASAIGIDGGDSVGNFLEMENVFFNNLSGQEALLGLRLNTTTGPISQVALINCWADNMGTGYQIGTYGRVNAFSCAADNCASYGWDIEGQLTAVGCTAERNSFGGFYIHGDATAVELIRPRASNQHNVVINDCDAPVKIEHPVFATVTNTTLVNNESSSATVLEVNDATNYYAGQYIKIELNSGTQDAIIDTVDHGTNTITILSGLTGDADSGNYVKPYDVVLTANATGHNEFIYATALPGAGVYKNAAAKLIYRAFGYYGYGLASSPAYPLHLSTTGVMARFNYPGVNSIDIQMTSGGLLDFQSTGGNKLLEISPNAPNGALQIASTGINVGGSLPLKIPILTSAPGTPANGMIVYADGTSWDPGSGAGFYGYEGGAWVKL